MPTRKERWAVLKIPRKKSVPKSRRKETQNFRKNVSHRDRFRFRKLPSQNGGRVWLVVGWRRSSGGSCNPPCLTRTARRQDQLVSRLGTLAQSLHQKNLDWIRLLLLLAVHLPCLHRLSRQRSWCAWKHSCWQEVQNQDGQFNATDEVWNVKKRFGRGLEGTRKRVLSLFPRSSSSRFCKTLPPLFGRGVENADQPAVNGVLTHVVVMIISQFRHHFPTSGIRLGIMIELTLNLLV